MKKVLRALLTIGILVFIGNVVQAGINDGLVAHYPLDGNANDIVGGNHGTPYGGVSYASGVMGQAVSFDGADDYILSEIGERLK